MKKICYLILLFASTSASAQYVSHGPGGGLAHNFYQDGGRTWLAAGSGVYYSNDDGISWSAVAASPSVFNCEDVLSVAAFGNEIYAGMRRSGILHSMDGGDTWSPVNNGLQKNSPYSDLEIAGPNALAIRSDSGALFLTSDHGTSWVRVNFAINQAQAFWISLHNNAVYVSTSQGLFKSVDNGLTYMNINPNLGDIGELSWSNDTAYASTLTGIKQSVDDGVTFNTIGLAGRPTQNVVAYGSTIFATVRSSGGQDSLKYSANGGATFSDAPFSTTSPFGQVYDIVLAGMNVLAGTDYGLYGSATAPVSFRKADSGFRATMISAMAVNGLRLYAASSPMGLFFTQDSAETWKHNGDLAHGVEGNIRAVDAKNQFVHAGGLLNYYRSSNFGTSWTTGASGLPAGPINSIYASKSSPDVLALQGGSLYRSSDDGSSFTAVTSGIPSGTAYLITQADTSVFIAASGGFYKGNSSFAFTATSGITNQVSSVVYRNGAYFASTLGSGLFTSLDGLAWRPEPVVAPGSLPLKVHALAINNNVMIAATDDGLYSDSTGVWTLDSLRGMAISSLAVMNGKLYAGTCRGVWSLQNLPAPVQSGIGGFAKENGRLSIYPNPSNGDVKAVFAADKSGAATLSLRNIMGHTVLERTVSLQAGRNELKLSAATLQLPAGIYLVQIATGSQIATQRLVLR